MKKFIYTGVVSFLMLAVIAAMFFFAFFLLTENKSEISNPIKQQTVVPLEDSCSNWSDVEYSTDGSTVILSTTMTLSSDEAEPFPDPSMDIYEEARKQYKEAEENTIQFEISDEFIFNIADSHDGNPLYSKVADQFTTSDNLEVVDLYGYMEELDRRCQSTEQ